MSFLEAHEMILWSGFAIAVFMGMVANKTNFCTMGAISDLINIGDSGRMRAWILAIAVSILSISILEMAHLINLGPELTRPAYRTSNFMWPRYLLGGLMFGIGMTLASGCGNKTLVRMGGGNIKSVVVFVVMGAMAYVMTRTNFNYNVFLQWMTPLFVDLVKFDINTQDIGGVIVGLTGMAGEDGSMYGKVNGIAGLVLAFIMMVLVFRSRSGGMGFDNIFAGIMIGLAVAGAWYLTSGSIGEVWMEEFEMADIQPEAVKAQSFTFVDPSGQAVYYLSQGASFRLVTFGLVAAAGVLLGSFLWSIMVNSFRIEWFSSMGDFIMHVIGGALMGMGGILAFGCTIGQAITGASTLALGSFLAFGSIVMGAALTMRFQLYRMVYEDASIVAVLVTALVDMRLLPAGLRQLEAV